MATPGALKPPQVHENLLPVIDGAAPTDSLLVDFRMALREDVVPTREYLNLAAGVQQGDELAQRRLLKSSSGLVAFVVHHYAGQSGTERERLMMVGAKGLLSGAASFDPDNRVDIEDHLILAIEEALAEETNLPTRPISGQNGKPMETVYANIKRVQAEVQLESQETRRQQASERERETYERKMQAKAAASPQHQAILANFPRAQRQVVPLLHLPTRQIAESLSTPTSSISYQSVIRAIYRARHAFDDVPPHTAALALRLNDLGFVYLGRPPIRPMTDALSFEDRFMGKNLKLPYEDLAEHMGSTVRQLDDRFYRASRRVGARSRAEFALMSRGFDTEELPELESTPRRRLLADRLGVALLKDCDLDLLLQATSPLQYELISSYYLGDDPKLTMNELSEQSGTPANSIQGMIWRGVDTMLKAKSQLSPS